MMTPSSRPWLGLAVAAAVLVLDQGTKWWIVEEVMNPPYVLEITSFFNIVLTLNRGVSFGMFSSDSDMNAWVLSAVAVTVVVALLAWLRKAESLWVAAGIGLIVGGALGNVVDRLRFGAVVDFLDVHAGTWHWPAFNVADSGITVGAAVLIVDSLFRGRESLKDRDSGKS